MGNINNNQMNVLSNVLLSFLQDTFNFYLAAHYHHWNVVGPQFTVLHELFETLYSDAWEAVDSIAERMRMLAMPVHGVHQTLSADISAVPLSESGDISQAMIKHLIAMNQTVIVSAKAALALAEEAGDVVTVDLITERLAAHDKHHWILSSLLQ